jgi:adenylate cyclase
MWNAKMLPKKPTAPFLTTKALRQAAITGLAAAFLALLPWGMGLWERWEAKTWDMRVAWMAAPGSATEDIALILLDQQSLDWAQEQGGLSWPWPREVYTAVVNFFRRAQVASLTFDVLFLEPSAFGVEDDAVLAESLALMGPTAMALFLSRAATGGLPFWPEGLPEPGWVVVGLDEWPGAASHLLATRISPPLPELAAAAGVLGNVQLRPDPDGVFRRMRPLDIFDERPVPSLGLAALLAAGNVSSGTNQSQPAALLDHRGLTLSDRFIPLDADGAAILRFRGPSGTHAAYSAAAVIQSELRLLDGLPGVVDPTEFRGKHVFFGFSAPGLFDLRPTPVSGVYPGVEIQATFLDNLLSGDFMRDFPGPVTVVLVLGLCLLTGLALAVWRSPLAGALALLAMLVVPVALAVFAYSQGWWAPLVATEAGVGMAGILGLLFNYSTEGRQRRFIKNAFQQYLSPQVIEQLIADPGKLKLGGERKVLSIFFSDLQGFTTISENLSPEALTALLNDYLTAMTEIIHEEGGTVDKFEGDAIIAFWNAPLDVLDHARRAVRAALRCQVRLAELRPGFRERTGHDLYMRIGINTGPAVVGNMGSHSRFDYSMLGDAVNLAARLEGVNKQFGTFTMISEATRTAAKEQSGDDTPMRELGRVAVVGRGEPVTVYEPLDEKFARANAVMLERFDAGLRAFYRADFTEAKSIFADMAEVDPAAVGYLEICRDHPPIAAEDWDGVRRMRTK